MWWKLMLDVYGPSVTNDLNMYAMAMLLEVVINVPLVLCWGYLVVTGVKALVKGVGKGHK